VLPLGTRAIFLSIAYSYVKAIAEELRGLAVEHNVPIVTATQTTRSGYNSSDVELTDT
jgi:flagellar biosynthesis protein FlhB